MDLPDWLTAESLQASLANAGGAGTRTAAQLPADRLEANLAGAWEEVRGGLKSAGFTPPADDTAVDAVSGLLLDIVLGIAGYTATLEFRGSLPLEERDPVNLRYQRAQQQLARAVAGKLAIDGVTEDDPGTAAGGAEVFGGVDVGLADGWLSDVNGYADGAFYRGMRGGW